MKDKRVNIMDNTNDLNIIEPQMVHIPLGIFLMGTTDIQAKQAINEGAMEMFVKEEQPQHEVELSEYFIGKYPVTNREYQAFIRDTKYSPPNNWDNDQYPAQKGEHPVIAVSWNDAQEYCKWLSQKTGKHYRLPSEAEWEKAARGMDGRVYPWGNDFDSKKCNVLDSKIGDTTPVGTFTEEGGDSPYGCADMSGNVWEWCNDGYELDEYKKRSSKTIRDPSGPEKDNGIKCMRGGSWGVNRNFARVSSRSYYDPRFKEGFIGFRLYCSASSTKD
jgi:toxoflavin biosynthesis protein ToxD